MTRRGFFSVLFGSAASLVAAKLGGSASAKVSPPAKAVDTPRRYVCGWDYGVATDPSCVVVEVSDDGRTWVRLVPPEVKR